MITIINKIEIEILTPLFILYLIENVIKISKDKNGYCYISYIGSRSQIKKKYSRCLYVSLIFVNLKKRKLLQLVLS